MKVMKRMLRVTATDLAEQDWQSLTIQSLNQSSLTVTRKNLEDFVVVNDELCHGGNGRVLARAMSLTKTKEELHRIQDLLCRENDITLHKCLQGRGLLA